MSDVKVSVRKLTDVSLMREACEATFDGVSHATLLNMYKAEHSPARTQLFWVTLKGVKLFISTHLIRHHVGSVPFQLSCREDRPGGNTGHSQRCEQIIHNLKAVDHAGDPHALIARTIDEVEWLEAHTDRNTPVNLSLLVNAQGLIDMAKLRLCSQAHMETRKIFTKIREAVASVDPDLAKMMVRKCVYRCGLCGEPRCCGFNHTQQFDDELNEYLSYFSNNQKIK